MLSKFFGKVRRPSNFSAFSFSFSSKASKNGEKVASSGKVKPSENGANFKRSDSFRKANSEMNSGTNSSLHRETSTSGRTENLISGALKMEEQLMHAMKLQSQSNFRRATALLCVAGLGAYFLWPRVKDDAGKEMAGVARIELC